MTDTSVWLGLFPKASEARRLEVVGGNGNPDDIHLTLAYLGEYTKESDLVKKKLSQLLTDLVYYRSMTPEFGVVTGYGVFTRPPVFFAIPSVPHLMPFRQYIVENLPTYDKTYEYIPHITLRHSAVFSYGPAIDLTFEGVTLVHGGEKTLIPWKA